MLNVGNMFYFSKSSGRFRRKIISDLFKLYFRNFESKVTHKTILSPWKILFYGTDTISEVTLRALNSNRLSNNDLKVVSSLEVVCIKSDCSVRRYATLNDITIHSWPFDVPPHVYDVGIVVSFGHMIPSSSILACKYGIINAHPSLLPRWRGAAPIFHTILNGDEKTGVTITQVSPNKFDVGSILMQEEFTVPERYTSKQLAVDLSQMAADMVLKTLRKLPHYVETSYPQSTEGRTLARKIKPQNCCINWAEESIISIDRKFRAFYGFFNLYTSWKGSMKVDILEVVSPQEVKNARIHDLVTMPISPGSCYFHKKRKVLYIRCQDGWTGIKLLRVPKTGKITALDFYNGFVTREDPKDCYFA